MRELDSSEDIAVSMNNSVTYWDSRFEKDWRLNSGPDQSKFFSEITINNLPEWFVKKINTEKLTFVDWGCAQGDGTHVWVGAIDKQLITGIDFSTVAVNQAKEKFPDLKFKRQDWLEFQDEKLNFDIVFSSNTLEHFSDPFEVLRKLSRYAEKAILLTLPFKENDRIEEHLFSFYPDNIPASLDNGFRLIWSKVVDCIAIKKSFWCGEQIVLIYAHPDWLKNDALTLKDCIVEDVDVRNLFDKKNYIKLEEKNEIIRLNSVLDEKELKIRNLNESVRSVSLWADRIEKNPIKYGIKKYILNVGRSVFKALPVSHSNKRLFRLYLSYLSSYFRLKEKQVKLLSPAGNDEWNLLDKKLATGLSVKDRDFLFFSVIDWQFRIQRPQQLARSLALQGHRVFFFSNHFVNAIEDGYSIERIEDSLDLFQVRLHVKGAPAIYSAAPACRSIDMIQSGIAKLIMDFAVVSSISIIQHPYWHPMVFRLPNTLRIYDCMDHHQGFGDVSKCLVDVEKKLLIESDTIVVTSSWLKEFSEIYNKKVELIRNAADYTLFSEVPFEIFKDPHGRKIIGYYGAIAEWFDVDLIRLVAQENSDSLVLLIGDDTANVEKNLKDIKNIQFIGEVEYNKLPYYLHGFDVCLLPFKKNLLTKATNPVKVYEYLSAGKPVVCVDLPEMKSFDGLVKVASDKKEFLKCVKDCLYEGISSNEVKRRRDFSSLQTWSHRAGSLNKAIENITLPKISVIVLAYNNLKKTKKCLKSLVNWSLYSNLEIIVVDNASSDGTPDFLKSFKLSHPSVKLIFNEDNLGFSAGNNIGLSKSTGDYLVLLNNDTEVTPGWLLTMLRHFQEDKSIGILGPVTNNIGNEAKIEINYDSSLSMVFNALSYTASHMGSRVYLDTVAFFCVMFTRHVYEVVGGLDENYGRGFFEDDDYCRRVEQAGFKVACAEDVFVHHDLSASFDKVGRKERDTLFEKNKKYYESKWGEWKAHKVRG